MDTVYMLVIEHRHGRNITVHKTEDGAETELFSFISQWWDYELNEKPMPDDRDEAIRQYFESVNHEHATIEPITLQN